MPRSSLHALFGLFALFGCLDSVVAELARGSAAITSKQVALVVNGSATVTISPGETVTVIGLRQASQEAVVSYQSPSGAKSIGIVPLDTLISVDAGDTSSTSPAAPPAAPASLPPTAQPTALDLTKTLPSVDIARLFKADKAAARTQYENQRLKFSGTIERLEVQNSLSGPQETPVLFLRTAPGLPRLKVALSSSLSSHDSYFRRYGTYLPGWWWGYSGRTLDCRMAGSTEIQGRAVYRSGSAVGGSRSSSAWFTLFKVGDPVVIEATCTGVNLDVNFDSGLLIGDK